MNTKNRELMNTLMFADEVQKVTGLSRSTIWRMENDGQFPKRQKISPRRIAWFRSDIESWLLQPADFKKLRGKFNE